jgi:Asp-tRNA(Asn)/Glu-tRNA(Gln) amidotransferase A subunit family amidase
MSNPKHTPTSDRSRRRFLRASSMVGLSGLVGTSLSACGGSDPAAPDPLTASSSDVLDAVQRGTLSAEACAQTLIARAKQQADLNSLIFLNETAALATARQIDLDRQAGKPLKPLAGLFIVVKDNINTADMPTTSGTPSLQGARPSTTAPSLKRLTDAGAIVLAKANLHELAFGITSTNLSFAKPVKNPYDKTRIPGGSSGGTAAAIAAGIVPCGLGTDTGGSTRVPAALCGVVGLRPSVGNGGTQRRYTDTNAVMPISHTRDTVGPLGRTVADVALLDSFITQTARAQPASLQGVRLGVPAAFWAGLDASVAPTAQAAKAKLAAAGAVLVDMDIPGLFSTNDLISFQVALHEPIADIPAYLAASGLTGQSIASIAAAIASPDVQGAFGAIQADVFGAAYPDAINIHRPALQKLYADAFATHKVEALLFPTTLLAATPMDLVKGSGTVSVNGGPPVDTFSTYIRNTDPGSNAGIPGLSVPAGLNAAGLPVGMELDGPLGSDQRLLSLGLALEAVLGRMPAPKL